MKDQISLTNCNTLVEILRWRARHQPLKRAYTFLVDGENEEVHLTYAELDQQARAIAARLQRMDIAGQQALLLYPPGLDFIAAFFGCLYAGVVAVPSYPPRRKRPNPRLQAIVRDAEPAVVLSDVTIREQVQQRATDELVGLPWLVTQQINLSESSGWQEASISAESLAFLQYTSGSTATPKGVMLTHGNLLHNLAIIQQGFEVTGNSVGVIWLPPYHDMGLIGGILEPLYAGFPVTLMSPIAFLQKPARWLHAISRYQGTISGGPNFAYDLCVEKITPQERATLDLSSWEVAFNGAEPIRNETLERFVRAFEPAGFRHEAFYPCYGLAEGTLIVSGGMKSAPPVVYQVDGNALVGCGTSKLGQEIAIVDPESAVLCAEGQVGEIWLKGASVAKGYWNKAQATEDTYPAESGTFHAYLTPPNVGATAGRGGAGPFLRTGDSGFLKDGELFVTGRIKDLIIIRGRNYYPQDIELSAESSHSALQPNAGAAFSVDVAGKERLVIMFELTRRQRRTDVEEVAEAIRSAVSQAHELEVYAVVLIRPNRIPKTTSGKIQRYACRNAFLEGSLPLIGTSIREAASVAHHDAEAAQGPVSFTQAQIEADLRLQIADLLSVPASKIDLQQSIQTLGLGSLTAVALQIHLEETYKLVLPIETFFEEISMSEMIARLLRDTPSATPSVMAEASEHMPTLAQESKLKTQPEPSDVVPDTDSISQEKQANEQTMHFSLFYFSSNEAAFAQDKYQLFLEGSKFADQHDFSAVWVPERHFHAFGGLYPNPSLLATALAMTTKQIRLRAGSVVLPLHDPIRVAEDWAVVDNLSQGRVDLSFATGWNPNDFVLSPERYDKRVEVTYSSIKTVQTLWRGESISQPNGIQQTHELRIYPQPQQKELNVWLTCSGGPQRFIDAGRLGYNVLTALLFQPLDELGKKIALYREARAQHGHDPETGHVTLMLHTYIGQEMEEVRDKVRGPFIDYLKSSVNLWQHGEGKPFEQLSEQEQQNMLTYAFERYYQTSALIGTPQTGLHMIERLKAIGVNEIACLIDFGVDMQSVLSSLNFLDQLKVLAEDSSRSI